MAKKRKCGSCGKSGHNARTCPNANSSAPVAKSGRKCGRCNSTNHTTLQHTAGDEGSSAPVTSPKNDRKCGKCGGVGHNARTCPEKEQSREEAVTARRRNTQVAVDAPTPVPAALKTKYVPELKLPAEEKSIRKREGEELVRYSRLVTAARCERWVKREHDIDGRRLEKKDLKVGQKIGLVETKMREPIAFEKAKIMKIVGDKVHYKINRDSTDYSTDFDFILNYKVPGRSMYYLVL